MTFQGESTMGLRFFGVGRVTLVATALALGGCPGDEDDDGSVTFDPTTVGTDPTTGTETGDPDDTGDETEDDDTATPNVTFAEVEPIFQERCVDGCHEPGGLWFTHDMTDIASIVGAPGPTQGTQCNLIEPNDPDRSYIWHKIVGTQNMNCGGSGAQMPVTPENVGVPDPLPQAQMDLIEDWINSGAPT
jgi:hypothetical protein